MRVAKELQNLVERFLPAEVTEAQKQRYISYCLRLLSARI